MDDQTMRILKMVQEGSISPEEANELLSKMDGDDEPSYQKTSRLDPEEEYTSDDEPFGLNEDFQGNSFGEGFEDFGEELGTNIGETLSGLGATVAEGIRQSVKIKNLFPFMGCDLNGAKLAGARFEGALFMGCDLRDADLRGADLRKARFMGTDLRNAKMRNADLQKSSFTGADLRGIKMDHAVLHKCAFWGSDLRGIDLNNIRAEGLKVSGADLRKVDLDAWLRSHGVDRDNVSEQEEGDPFAV